MIAIGIAVNNTNPPVPFVPITEYQAVLTETLAIGGTLPSLQVQRIHNKLIADAIADGKWAATRYFLAIQHDAATNHYATINFVNPTGPKASFVNTTFRSNIGHKGNGTTSHIMTEYNPFLDASLNGGNCSYFFYGDDDFSNNGVLFGGVDLSDRQIYLYNFPTTNNWNIRLSSSTNRSSSIIAKTAKFNSISYDGANVVVKIGNQTQSFAQTGTQTKLNIKLALLGRNANGVIDARSIKTASYFGVGDSTVAAYFESKLDAAFAALRPAYAPYQLWGEVNPENLATMWQDAAKTVPATLGSPVRVINTGLWGDLVANADSDRPLLVANALNGKPALDYDGVDDNVDFPSPITGDMCLIFVFKNTDAVNGSQLMSGSLYITLTGASYPGNSSYGNKEYIISHPADGSGTAGVAMKNANSFNTFAFTTQGNVFQEINGWGITGRATNNSPMTLNKMGDPFNSLWQVQGQLPRLLYYKGCPPDSVIENILFANNSYYNI